MGEKKYKVIISDRSMRMLGEHIRFLAKADKAAAIQTKKSLMDAMKSLSHMPNRFPFVSAPHLIPNKYHKMYVPNWYLILYQIQDDKVCIDYILDCRKDYQWLIS